MSFYEPGAGVLFCGDVLFAGSVGRTDLPDGDHETLLASIRDKLAPLPGATRVFPGHGPPTTIAEELATNPTCGAVMTAADILDGRRRNAGSRLRRDSVH